MFRPFHVLDFLLGLKRRFMRRPGQANGVLLIAAGGLGDTVLFSLFARRFAALARDGEPVGVLLRADAAKMAFLLPRRLGLEVVDFGKFRKSLSYRRKIANRLHKAHYRLVISCDHLRHPYLDEALVRMAAPDQAFAMQPRSWPKYDAALNANRKLYSRLFDSGPDRLDKVARWNDFANWLDGGDKPPPKVRINIDDSGGGETFDVLIQPFSAVPMKQSPAALYRRIIESLPDGATVAICGGPGDLPANPEFRQLLELPGVVFNGSTFEDLVPALKAARLVISVDTALMHLAMALGAPTIGLASAAYVGEIVPYAAGTRPENAHFIYQEMACQGCLGNCLLKPVDGMYPCVAGLDRDRIMALVETVMGA